MIDIASINITRGVPVLERLGHLEVVDSVDAAVQYAKTHLARPQSPAALIDLAPSPPPGAWHRQLPIEQAGYALQLSTTTHWGARWSLMAGAPGYDFSTWLVRDHLDQRREIDITAIELKAHVGSTRGVAAGMVVDEVLDVYFHGKKAGRVLRLGQAWVGDAGAGAVSTVNYLVPEGAAVWVAKRTHQVSALAS